MSDFGEELLPCPNCETGDVFVADRANYVVCRSCKMTGPVGRFEEEGVIFWNRLPRRNPTDIKITQDLIPDGLKGGL